MLFNVPSLIQANNKVCKIKDDKVYLTISYLQSYGFMAEDKKFIYTNMLQYLFPDSLDIYPTINSSNYFNKFNKEDYKKLLVELRDPLDTVKRDYMDFFDSDEYLDKVSTELAKAGNNLPSNKDIIELYFKPKKHRTGKLIFYTYQDSNNHTILRCTDAFRLDITDISYKLNWRDTFDKAIKDNEDNKQVISNFYLYNMWNQWILNIDEIDKNTSRISNKGNNKIFIEKNREAINVLTKKYLHKK